MPGPRVYTVAEVNELIPELEARFEKLDELRRRLKSAKIRLDAVEMIWGGQIHNKDCPDHDEYEHHLDDLKSIEEEFQKIAGSFAEFGATVKGLEPGLLDFYAVREGHLIYLCWRRGEERCEFWHHVDAGFSGREPV